MKSQLLFSWTLIAISSLVIIGCGGSNYNEATNDLEIQSGFVTKLGNDTLAMELFSISENEATAMVLLRSPQTTIRTYTLTFNDDGGMLSLSSTYKDPLSDSITREDKYYWDGDSLRFEISQGERSRSGAAVAFANTLPFIDMVHWPFDIMLKQAYQNEGVSLQPLISGSRVFNFELNKISADSMTVKHPTRGTMGVTVTESGELYHLEASQTTRALTVQRISSFDFEMIANDFAQRDKSGNPFGALSGRGETDTQVLGANIKIDYGTPVKRGREIWGSLIKYGVRWRTGANRATHFSTDTDLMFGDLEVPAGEYTLFSIPEEDGGLLLINTQTGQNGQTYDEALDLGRVDLQFRNLDDVVEVFTISVSEENGMGMLKLQWDNQELVTPFTLK